MVTFGQFCFLQFVWLSSLLLSSDLFLFLIYELNVCTCAFFFWLVFYFETIWVLNKMHRSIDRKHTKNKHTTKIYAKHTQINDDHDTFHFYVDKIYLRKKKHTKTKSELEKLTKLVLNDLNDADRLAHYLHFTISCARRKQQHILDNPNREQVPKRLHTQQTFVFVTSIKCAFNKTETGTQCEEFKLTKQWWQHCWRGVHFNISLIPYPSLEMNLYSLELSENNKFSLVKINKQTKECSGEVSQTNNNNNNRHICRLKT